jgi:hypothetical protein
VVGALLVLVSLALLGRGNGSMGRPAQRDAGYITSDIHEFSTSGSALATERTDLGSAGTRWLYSPALLDKVRIRVPPASPGQALFLGIGRSADVDRYLAGVNHTVVSDLWTDKVDVVKGETPASAPETQNFWVASATGLGTQTVVWDPTNGSWTVVVMNPDGRPAIDVAEDLGARLPALPGIALGLLAVGVVFAIGGTLLITGAIRSR